MLELKNRNCPVCSSSDTVLTGKPRRIDRVFSAIKDLHIQDCRIVQCTACTLYFVQPFPFFSEELLEKMYSNENNYFQELTERTERIIHYENPERRFRTIERRAERPIENYLEIGCGQGFGLLAAQKRGWKVSGQDVSPDFAGTVKEKTGVDIVVGQLRPDSFKEEFFDVIYIDSVLEHVPNPLEFLSLIRRFLAPHGIVYLILPNEGSIPNLFMDAALKLTGSKATSRMMPFSEPYHILGFTKKSIIRLSESTGLKVERVTCSHSHAGIERYQRPFSLPRFVKRTAFGIIHKFCDGINEGINMEVVITKRRASVGGAERMHL